MAKNKNNASHFDDVSSYSSKKEYKKRRKNKRGRTVLKSITAVLSVLVLLFGSMLIYVSTNVVDGLSTVNITRDKDELGITDLATNDTSIKNIALFGLDTRDGTFKGLSDTIIVLSIDNRHNKIKMTSILRDTRVTINGSKQKINAAYSLGGAELAIKTINENFNLNIEDYVSVNFSGLAEIIDALGGVDMEMSKAEIEQTNNNLYALMWEQIHDGLEQTIMDSDILTSTAAGTYHLNGNQAVAFARIRKGVDNSGDTGRAERQKSVIISALGNLSEMSTSDYLPLLQKVFPLCETSMSVDDIWAFTPMLSNSYNVETITVPGDYENPAGGNYNDGVGWVYVYDFERASKRIDLFIYEELSQYYSEDDTSSITNDTDGLVTNEEEE